MSDRPQTTQDLAEVLWEAVRGTINAHQDLTIRMDGLDRRVRELRGNERRTTDGTDNPIFAEVNHLQKRLTALEESIAPFLSDRYSGQEFPGPDPQEEMAPEEEPPTVTELFKLMERLANLG